MIDAHHTVEVAYVLAITMWGFTGAEWQFIGNEIILQQALTEAQCQHLISEGMWEANYQNQYYRLMAHCLPQK